MVHFTLACFYGLVEVFNCSGTRASAKFRSSAKALRRHRRLLSTCPTPHLVLPLRGYPGFLSALRLRISQWDLPRGSSESVDQHRLTSSLSMLQFFFCESCYLSCRVVCLDKLWQKEDDHNDDPDEDPYNPR